MYTPWWREASRVRSLAEGHLKTVRVLVQFQTHASGSGYSNWFHHEKFPKLFNAMDFIPNNLVALMP
jgi:alpha-L-fucosidase